MFIRMFCSSVNDSTTLFVDSGSERGVFIAEYMKSIEQLTWMYCDSQLLNTRAAAALLLISLQNENKPVQTSCQETVVCSFKPNISSSCRNLKYIHLRLFRVMDDILENPIFFPNFAYRAKIWILIWFTSRTGYTTFNPYILKSV